MNLLLRENLLLRTSRDLGDYAEDFVLALRFGDLSRASFKCGRLSDKEFCAAGHAMRITSVQTDAVEEVNYDVEVRPDGLGGLITVIVYGAAVPLGATVTACGIGMLNPLTGALLENPADIVEFLFRFQGRTETFSDFRAECAAAGFRAAGSIEAAMSLRDATDDIMGSFGAIWTQTGARIYPSAPSGFIGELDYYTVANLTFKASDRDIGDVLRIAYDVRTSDGTPQHYIEFRANPQTFGGLVQAPPAFNWLRRPVDADKVSRPRLLRIAGQRYDVTFDKTGGKIRPREWYRLVNHPELSIDAVNPLIMILAVTAAPSSDSAACEGETIIASPAVELSAHSLALPGTTSATVDTGLKDGVFLATIVGDDNKPAPGARVSFDGGPAKVTDAKGQVSFPAGHGHHVLVIALPGADVQTLPLNL